MRVLIAHSFYRLPGGEDRYVRQQLDLLRSEHDVELVERRNEALAGGLSTAKTMTFSARVTREVQEHIAAFKPDVIHLHNPYPSLGPAVHLAAARSRIPLVQTIHNLRLRCPNGVMFTEGRPCRRCEPGNYTNATIHHCFPTRSQATGYAASLWLHRFALRLERLVAGFIAPSAFMVDRLRDWRIPDERISLVRTFVPSIAPSPSPVGDFGVYVGRLSDEKGLTTLLEALARAMDPPFRIVGDGPLYDELVAMSGRLGLERTRFLGRLDPAQTAAVVSGSRFLVMPSECDENAPLAALEAMAAGRPIVVSERGGLPELASHGAGLVFTAGDADAMSERMRTLFADRERCQMLAEGAWRFAASELRPERHLRTLLAVYRGVLDASGDAAGADPFDGRGFADG